MELLGRVCTALGISLVLTLLLLVLYQDDPQAQMERPQPAAMTQVSAGVEPIITPAAATSVTVR